jgi:predicted metal-dependent hydrolase
MERGIIDGFRLFNAGQYFEAHEALEAVWLKATGNRKRVLHGLIQVSAAFHHHSSGNRPGFRSLLEKGCAKLEPFGAEFEGIDLAALMLQLQVWRDHFRVSSLPAPSAPQLPQIKLRGKPESG